MPIGISLGWNCYSASYSVNSGDRERKSEGYNTCPFDMGLTNYMGVVQCIKDDFKYFMDVDIVEIPDNLPYMANDIVIYNKHYNFIFNHESPHHKNLWITEGWSGGKGHFVNDKFKRFIERYNNRIINFRNYLNSGEKILFIITKENDNVTELREAIASNYPNLDYSIKRLDLELGKDHYYSHLQIMGCNTDRPTHL